MGSPMEDVEIAIINPFLTILLFLFLWKYGISQMSNCIIGVSDKLVIGLVIAIAHLASLRRMFPYEGEFIPTPSSTEMVLLFAASYYLKTAFCSDSKTDISYNLLLFIMVLDIVSYKKGGDTTLYFLALLEAPDFISNFLLPVLKTEGCYDSIYTVLYIAFKICLLGKIVYYEIMNSRISEDIKMNIFMVYLYSVVCLPVLLLSCYQFYSGQVDTYLSCLPQLSRRRKEVPRCKGCKQRSYSRGRRR